jgi:adenylate cyclase
VTATVPTLLPLAWAAAREWLSSAALAGVPQHVCRRIAEQRRRNEIFAGWVQLGLVAVFALLYAFSRKTFSPGAGVEPVPWALAVYGAFTLLRLHLAFRDRLTHSLLMTSVVVDIAVLLITVWTFHLQYGQPAAFYVKVPTLLYIFIFIALRSLSLAPGYVIFAGLVSAAGWAALVGYAIAEPGGRDLVTRDYVEYMTSVRILIGGEIDKVISILLVTAVLAVASARSRSLLHQAVADEQAAARLSRFFSPDIAETIVKQDDALDLGRGRQTEGAAMFIDLRGFSSLSSRLPPRELIALLGEYQGLVVPIIGKHRGSITTFLGDGIMASFGAVPRSETYAADALRAAEELIASLGAWAHERAAAGKPAPGIGIGVDSGTVICGPIGEAHRLEYAVIGDPVNRAAKLQNHTKLERAQAVTTSQTLARAMTQGYAAKRAPRVLPARSVAGIDGVLDLAAIG